MTIRYRTYAAYAATLIGLAVAFAAVSHTRAGESCCGSKAATSTRNSRQPDYGPVQQRNDPAFRPPHGGQLSKTLWHQFEVIYGPQETRLYLYDVYRGAVSTRDVQGQVVMRVRSNGGRFQYPLRYVPVESGQDYLVATVDLTHVEDGDMDVHYELAGLANREAPTAEFSQVFSMTTLPPQLPDQHPMGQGQQFVSNYRGGPVRLPQASAPAKTSRH
jgi:hypothetical protein